MHDRQTQGSTLSLDPVTGSSVLPAQLPVYVPSSEEQADPALYASNVRTYMVGPHRAFTGRHLVAVVACTSCHDSASAWVLLQCMMLNDLGH